ncbi:hypothetical protein QW131_02425 [Roseibium salinum]|nr:hypothetical protein [Roseibium salinum]
MEGAMDQASVYTPLVINAIKAVIVLMIGWFFWPPSFRNWPESGSSLTRA